jgi:hypothetical protein
MHTPSIRTLASLAYERGEEFDPGTPPTPALMEILSITTAARPIVSGPATHQRSLPRGQADSACVDVPDWFAPCDLVDPQIAVGPVAVVHGELV